MDKTRTYTFLAWLLYLSCITCGSDVKTKVGRVEYGEGTTLKCIFLPPNTAMQVIWTKVVGEKETTVATYTSDFGPKISKDYENRLWMSTPRLNETAITVNKTSIQDEGCYRCIFYFLPKESKIGEMCITIPGQVLIEKHHQVRLFQPVTLKCIMRKPSNVVQITWQKNGKNIATYTDKANIAPEYQKVISVTSEGWNVSSLTLFRANVSDDGKYSCIFNIFPGGAVTGETFVRVYEPLKVNLTKDHVNGDPKITCEVTSWPPSEVYWLDAEEGSLNGTISDGFLTVRHWIVINSKQKKMPKCKVLYLGEQSIFSATAGTRCQLHPIIIGLLVFKLFFL